MNEQCQTLICQTLSGMIHSREMLSALDYKAATLLPFFTQSLLAVVPEVNPSTPLKTASHTEMYSVYQGSTACLCICGFGFADLYVIFKHKPFHTIRNTREQKFQRKNNVCYVKNSPCTAAEILQYVYGNPLNRRVILTCSCFYIIHVLCQRLVYVREELTC